MTGPAITLFAVTALGAVLGAIVTIAARRPLRAAFGLLIHIVALAGMYLTLHAQLLAALQLLVYAGAVVVLFVFVIMLIGPASEVHGVDGQLISRTVSATLVLTVFLTIATVVARVSLPWSMVEERFGTVEGLGTAIYTEALVPFELVSITLLVAIIGAVAVARGRTASETALIAKARTQVAEEAAE